MMLTGFSARFCGCGLSVLSTVGDAVDFRLYVQQERETRDTSLAHRLLLIDRETGDDQAN
jgi:hypothetical protein